MYPAFIGTYSNKAFANWGNAVYNTINLGNNSACSFGNNVPLYSKAIAATAVNMVRAHTFYNSVHGAVVPQ